MHCAVTLESPCASIQDVTPQITKHWLPLTPTLQPWVEKRTKISAARWTFYFPLSLSLSLALSDCPSHFFNHALCCTFHYWEAWQIQYWLLGQLCTIRLFGKHVIRSIKATARTCEFQQKRLSRPSELLYFSFKLPPFSSMERWRANKIRAETDPSCYCHGYEPTDSL